MRASSQGRNEPSLAFGGQALIEGVMIRSRKHMVICVKQPNGKMLIKTEEISSLSERHRVLRLPFIRGVVALFEALYLGIKALFFSANAVLEEEGEKFTYKEIAIVVVMTLALMSFFMIVPFLLVTLLKLTGATFYIVEAVVRLAIFLLYLTLVSQWGEFKRVLQYHGAEHKAINAYEAGVALNVATAKKFSRLHPRCGTSLIFLVMLVSILLFSIMPNLGFLANLAYRVILIPVIGAVSYEILRFSDRHRGSKVMKLLVMPGLGLQRLATREPDDDMIAVALKAVNEVDKLRRST
jgi:uncharacterized protein YqhQ